MRIPATICLLLACVHGAIAAQLSDTTLTVGVTKLAVTLTSQPLTGRTVEVQQSTTGPAVSTTPTASSLPWRQMIQDSALADEFTEGVSSATVVIYSQVSQARYPGTAYAKSVETTVPQVGRIGLQPSGSLTGRVVFCSGGHGWTNETTTGLWYTQRPITHGVVEDLANIDQFNLFADICFRAGATVVPMRPLGHQLNERVVDNVLESACKFEGPWYDSASTVFYGTARDRVPYRFAVASTTETAVARFRPFLPEAGYYPLYTWVRHGRDRSCQTYRIYHSGGATEVRVNHRRVGSGWVYLGQYHFDRGWGGWVDIPNTVCDPYEADGRHVIVADAIRFGNGMGDVNRAAGISSRPREEEASRYWVERSLDPHAIPIHLAFDASDQDTNVGCPPRMAARMNRELEGTFFDRIYLGFHTNAVGGRGIVGLFENDLAMRPDFQIEWAELIARQLNEDMTTVGAAKWPVEWVVRKKLTDSHINFGEIRRDYLNNEMVATINEVAFHDNVLDAQLLRMPEFRSFAARSSYKAVLRFLNAHDPDKPAYTFLPEAPRILSARIDETSGVTVAWAPPEDDQAGGAPPEQYRIRHSTNGFGFDAGIATTSLSMRFEGLTTETAHYFQVSSVNAGGESLPSRVLGVNFGTTAGRCLIVSAFRNTTADMNLTNTAVSGLGSAFAPGGEYVRIIPRLMNAGNYVAYSGAALAELGRGFDSCTEECFAETIPDLKPWSMVVAEYGQETSPTRWQARIEKRLKSHLDDGGHLLLSGAHLSGVLARTDNEQSLAGKMGFGFGDSAGEVHSVRGTEAAFLSTTTLALSDGTGLVYPAVGLDALTTTGRSRALLRYCNEEGGLAAIHTSQWENGGSGVVLGFPFETIVGGEQRRLAMDSVLRDVGLGGGVESTAKPTHGRESRRESRRTGR